MLANNSNNKEELNYNLALNNSQNLRMKLVAIRELLLDHDILSSSFPEEKFDIWSLTEENVHDTLKRNDYLISQMTKEELTNWLVKNKICYDLMVNQEDVYCSFCYRELIEMGKKILPNFDETR